MKLRTGILTAVSALSLATVGVTTISSFTDEAKNNTYLEAYDSSDIKELDTQKSEQRVYWYGGKSHLTITNDFSVSANAEKYFYWEVNLGKIDILNGYTHWTGIDDENDSETWTSWGNTRYTGTAWKNVNESTILHVDLNQWGSVDNGAIYNNANIKLLDTEQWSGAAYLKTQQYVGISSFKRNNNYYLSVFGYQKASTAWSMSGGRMFMDLGNGVKFID